MKWKHNSKQSETVSQCACELLREYRLIKYIYFGIESLAVNIFEQCWFNYTNQKLQGLYNTDIFQSVQEELEYEGSNLIDVPFTKGIRMTNTSFTNNAIVFNLIEEKIGNISALNEYCIRPKKTFFVFV